MVDTASSTGGFAGSLGTGASLFDSSFLNVFVSSFLPGASLTFRVDIVYSVAGPVPDQWSLALLRGDGSAVTTQDPSGADALLSVDLGSGPLVFQTFASSLIPVRRRPCYDCRG